MRALTSADRNRVFATLEAWCSTGNVVSMRTRALIALAADSGLRVSECCALDAVQVLAHHPGPNGPSKLASSLYLRPNQAKGGRAGSGTVELSARCRRAILAYLRAAVRAGWIAWPPSAHAPLFVGHRGRAGAIGHGRLSVRSAQHGWTVLQQRAGLSSHYGFHALRHDAASRWRAAGADLFQLMQQMRWRDAQTAQAYIHELDAATAARRTVRRLDAAGGR